MFYKLKEDNRFEISKSGIIRNEKTKAIKSQYVSSTGYYMITISKNNKSKPYKVHRLLANNFIENPQNLKEVNHIDGNKLNNELTNLEWVTHFGNMQHAFSTGLANNTGEKNGMAKLNEIKVAEIKELLKQGVSQYKIACKYSVSRSAILKIHLGKTWRLTPNISRHKKNDTSNLFHS